MITGMKKRLCNPPANEVAGTGDPEVLGMFKGAGDGLAAALAAEDSAEYAEAAKVFEKAASIVEADYVKKRKALADHTVKEMHKVFDAFILATGGEVYGGG